MSVSIILVPLAIAAVGAWQASRQEVNSEGAAVCHVQTRMRDQQLLGRALQDTRAVVSMAPDAVVARWSGLEAEFRRDGAGIWQANFTGDVDVERATEIVLLVDVAYGRLVQQTVLARLRQRAPEAGMSIASETVESDESVTLLLNVQRQAT